MVFVLMLTLQLSGSIILLQNGLKTSREAVIRNCFPGSNVVKRDDNDECVIPKEKMHKSALPIYLNITAFADLVLGYCFAAFSPASQYATVVSVALVALFTFIITRLEWSICNRVVHIKYVKDERVPYDVLEQNGVDTVITHKEIDKIFNRTNRSE